MVRLTPVKSVAVANDAAGRYAVGPSKYPERTTQSVGKLAGEPVLPHDDTLVKVAPLRSAPVKVVPAKMALVRSAPIRFVVDRFAPTIFALERFTPEKFNVLRSAPVRLAVGPTR